MKQLYKSLQIPIFEDGEYNIYFSFPFLTKNIIVFFLKLWEFWERLDKIVKTILNKIAENLKGEGTVMHIWRSESYSVQIFFYQKNIYYWSFSYQISYFYALFYEKNTKQIMWKFKLNFLRDLKGSCFLNRCKSIKLTVEKWYRIIERVARCGFRISQKYYQKKYFCYLLAGFWRQS